MRATRVPVLFALFALFVLIEALGVDAVPSQLPRGINVLGHSDRKPSSEHPRDVLPVQRRTLPQSRQTVGNDIAGLIRSFMSGMVQGETETMRSLTTDEAALKAILVAPDTFADADQFDYDERRARKFGDLNKTERLSSASSGLRGGAPAIGVVFNNAEQSRPPWKRAQSEEGDKDALKEKDKEAFKETTGEVFDEEDEKAFVTQASMQQHSIAPPTSNRPLTTHASTRMPITSQHDSGKTDAPSDDYLPKTLESIAREVLASQQGKQVARAAAAFWGDFLKEIS